MNGLIELFSMRPFHLGVTGTPGAESESSLSGSLRRDGRLLRYHCERLSLHAARAAAVD